MDSPAFSSEEERADASEARIFCGVASEFGRENLFVRCDDKLGRFLGGHSPSYDRHGETFFVLCLCSECRGKHLNYSDHNGNLLTLTEFCQHGSGLPEWEARSTFRTDITIRNAGTTGKEEPIGVWMRRESAALRSKWKLRKTKLWVYWCVPADVESPSRPRVNQSLRTRLSHNHPRHQDNDWYRGTLQSFDETTGCCQILYEDNTFESICPAAELLSFQEKEKPAKGTDSINIKSLCCLPVVDPFSETEVSELSHSEHQTTREITDEQGENGAQVVGSTEWTPIRRRKAIKAAGTQSDTNRKPDKITVASAEPLALADTLTTGEQDRPASNGQQSPRPTRMPAKGPSTAPAASASEQLSSSAQLPAGSPHEASQASSAGNPPIPGPYSPSPAPLSPAPPPGSSTQLPGYHIFFETEARAAVAAQSDARSQESPPNSHPSSNSAFVQPPPPPPPSPPPPQHNAADTWSMGEQGARGADRSKQGKAGKPLALKLRARPNEVRAGAMLPPQGSRPAAISPWRAQRNKGEVSGVDGDGNATFPSQPPPTVLAAESVVEAPPPPELQVQQDLQDAQQQTAPAPHTHARLPQQADGVGTEEQASIQASLSAAEVKTLPPKQLEMAELQPLHKSPWAHSAASNDPAPSGQHEPPADPAPPATTAMQMPTPAQDPQQHPSSSAGTQDLPGQIDDRQPPAEAMMEKVPALSDTGEPDWSSAASSRPQVATISLGKPLPQLDHLPAHMLQRMSEALNTNTPTSPISRLQAGISPYQVMSMAGVTQPGSVSPADSTGQAGTSAAEGQPQPQYSALPSPVPRRLSSLQPTLLPPQRSYETDGLAQHLAVPEEELHQAKLKKPIPMETSETTEGEAAPEVWQTPGQDAFVKKAAEAGRQEPDLSKDSGTVKGRATHTLRLPLSVPVHPKPTSKKQPRELDAFKSTHRRNEEREVDNKRTEAMKRFVVPIFIEHNITEAVHYVASLLNLVSDAFVEDLSKSIWEQHDPSVHGPNITPQEVAVRFVAMASSSKRWRRRVRGTRLLSLAGGFGAASQQVAGEDLDPSLAPTPLPRTPPLVPDGVTMTAPALVSAAPVPPSVAAASAATPLPSSSAAAAQGPQPEAGLSAGRSRGRGRGRGRSGRPRGSGRGRGRGRGRQAGADADFLADESPAALENGAAGVTVAAQLGSSGPGTLQGQSLLPTDLLTGSRDGLVVAGQPAELGRMLQSKPQPPGPETVPLAAARDEMLPRVQQVVEGATLPHRPGPASQQAGDMSPGVVEHQVDEAGGRGKGHGRGGRRGRGRGSRAIQAGGVTKRTAVSRGEFDVHLEQDREGLMVPVGKLRQEAGAAASAPEFIGVEVPSLAATSAAAAATAAATATVKAAAAALSPTPRGARGGRSKVRGRPRGRPPLKDRGTDLVPVLEITNLQDHVEESGDGDSVATPGGPGSASTPKPRSRSRKQRPAPAAAADSLQDPYVFSTPSTAALPGGGFPQPSLAVQQQPHQTGPTVEPSPPGPGDQVWIKGLIQTPPMSDAGEEGAAAVGGGKGGQEATSADTSHGVVRIGSEGEAAEGPPKGSQHYNRLAAVGISEDPGVQKSADTLAPVAETGGIQEASSGSAALAPKKPKESSEYQQLKERPGAEDISGSATNQDTAGSNGKGNQESDKERSKTYEGEQEVAKGREPRKSVEAGEGNEADAISSAGEEPSGDEEDTVARSLGGDSNRNTIAVPQGDVAYSRDAIKIPRRGEVVKLAEHGEENADQPCGPGATQAAAEMVVPQDSSRHDVQGHGKGEAVNQVSKRLVASASAAVEGPLGSGEGHEEQHEASDALGSAGMAPIPELQQTKTPVLAGLADTPEKRKTRTYRKSINPQTDEATAFAADTSGLRSRSRPAEPVEMEQRSKATGAEEEDHASLPKRHRTLPEASRARSRRPQLIVDSTDDEATVDESSAREGPEASAGTAESPAVSSGRGRHNIRGDGKGRVGRGRGRGRGWGGRRGQRNTHQEPPSSLLFAKQLLQPQEEVLDSPHPNTDTYPLGSPIPVAPPSGVRDAETSTATGNIEAAVKGRAAKEGHRGGRATDSANQVKTLAELPRATGLEARATAAAQQMGSSLQAKAVASPEDDTPLASLAPGAEAGVPARTKAAHDPAGGMDLAGQGHPKTKQRLSGSGLAPFQAPAASASQHTPIMQCTENPPEVAELSGVHQNKGDGTDLQSKPILRTQGSEAGGWVINDGLIETPPGGTAVHPQAAMATPAGHFPGRDIPGSSSLANRTSDPCPFVGSHPSASQNELVQHPFPSRADTAQQRHATSSWHRKTVESAAGPSGQAAIPVARAALPTPRAEDKGPTAAVGDKRKRREEQSNEQQGLMTTPRQLVPFDEASLLPGAIVSRAKILGNATVDPSDIVLQLEMNDAVLDLLQDLEAQGRLNPAEVARFMVCWHGMDPVRRLLTFSTLERSQRTDAGLRVLEQMVRVVVPEHSAPRRG